MMTNGAGAVWTEQSAWYCRHCRRVQAAAQQIIDGTRDPASAADEIVCEGMRIREKAQGGRA